MPSELASSRPSELKTMAWRTPGTAATSEIIQPRCSGFST